MQDRAYHDGNTSPGPLGPPIRRAPPPPEPVEIAPGVWRDPDGKMRTQIPTEAEPKWPFAGLKPVHWAAALREIQERMRAAK